MEYAAKLVIHDLGALELNELLAQIPEDDRQVRKQSLASGRKGEVGSRPTS